MRTGGAVECVILDGLGRMIGVASTTQLLNTTTQGANLVSPDELRSLLRRRPFRPFRIAMSNDEKFEVWHPEMAIVASSIVAVGLGRPNDPEPTADKVIWLDLNQIVHIEPLSMQPASQEP
jgi:hypothetical protein